MFSKDLVCGFDSLTDFQKIQPVFTNPEESLVLQHKTNPQKSRFANPKSLQIQAGLKIHIANSICRPFFKRFVSCIQFVRPKISTYSIRFVLEGFMYKSRFLTYSSLKLKIWTFLTSTKKYFMGLVHANFAFCGFISFIKLASFSYFFSVS